MGPSTSTSRRGMILSCKVSQRRSRTANFPVPKNRTGLSFAEIVKGYLNEKHRDAPGIGCAVAALVSDLGRANHAKDLYTADVRRRIENTAARSSGADAKKKRKQAIVAVSAMAELWGWRERYGKASFRQILRNGSRTSSGSVFVRVVNARSRYQNRTDSRRPATDNPGHSPRRHARPAELNHPWRHIPRER